MLQRIGRYRENEVRLDGRLRFRYQWDLLVSFKNIRCWPRRARRELQRHFQNLTNIGTWSWATHVNITKIVNSRESSVSANDATWISDINYCSHYSRKATFHMDEMYHWLLECVYSRRKRYSKTVELLQGRDCGRLIWRSDKHLKRSVSFE